MSLRSPLPKQPSLWLSYVQVGALLYLSLVIFSLETYVYWQQLEYSYSNQNLIQSIFWFCSVLFAFSHIFLVLMDGWSRFQNYKRVKDHLFVHGFTPKIARHYRGSKCQRMAVLVAARELGFEEEVKDYYKRHGIRWYHFIPQFMLKDPLFLFRSYFWSRTFMEKYYEPRFDFRKLEQELNADSEEHN